MKMQEKTMTDDSAGHNIARHWRTKVQLMTMQDKPGCAFSGGL